MPTFEEILEPCRARVRRGELTAAARAATRFTVAYPDEGSGWILLGQIRHRQRDLIKACHALETASLLVPLGPPTQATLAECFAGTGYPDLARSVYLAMATDDRTPENLMPAVAAGLGLPGEYGLALRVCLNLTRRSPALPEAHFGVAFYLRKPGRPPEAVLPVVARAHELSPVTPLYRVSLATLLDHVGRRDEARELLRGVDLDAVLCRCRVQRMTSIFLAPRESSISPGSGESTPLDYQS